MSLQRRTKFTLDPASQMIPASLSTWTVPLCRRRTHQGKGMARTDTPWEAGRLGQSCSGSLLPSQTVHSESWQTSLTSSDANHGPVHCSNKDLAMCVQLSTKCFQSVQSAPTAHSALTARVVSVIALDVRCRNVVRMVSFSTPIVAVTSVPLPATSQSAQRTFKDASGHTH